MTNKGNQINNTYPFNELSIQLNKGNGSQNNKDVFNLNKMSSSISILEIKIGNKKISASGFLAKIKLPNLNLTLHGIITNAHILKGQNLLNFELDITTI